MALLLVTFVSLSAVIVVAAIFLAKFGDEIADRTGLGGSVTGLVLLAGATSLPELSVGFSAVQMDAADLTAGGVLGSSLANLLILSLVDLISRRPGRIFTRSAAAHALSATVGALLTGLILLGIIYDTPWSLLRIGPFSWAVITAYGFCARLIYLDQRESTRQLEIDRRHQVSAEKAKQVVEEDVTPSEVIDKASGGKVLGGEITSGEVPAASKSAVVSFLGFGIAALVIFLIAPMLATTADEIASITGLGRTFVGTLLLALVTSLPEAVSTIAAVRLGAIDMAISNIFGSNAFNMVILAVLDVASGSPILSLVSETHALTATCVLITTSVALLSVLYRAEKRLWLIEPDAALIALLVIGSLYLVYLNG